MVSKGTLQMVTPCVISVPWSDVAEIIKTVGSVVTAVVAVIGVSIAYSGLEKWRAELSGKRRSELAVTTLADFYQAQEVIRQARGRFVMNQEMTSKEGIPDEIAKDALYVPEWRLMQSEDLFARLRARKHEFAAVFGSDKVAPFEQILRVRIDINHAVDNMLRNKEIQSARDKDSRAQWKEWHDIAFGSDDDALMKRVGSALRAMEAICRPAIDARNK